jgi:NAD(P)H-flavin reductase
MWSFFSLLRFGTLSFVCLLILLITSLQRVRNIAYEWFYNCHIFLGPLSLFFACLHSINMRYVFNPLHLIISHPLMTYILHFFYICSYMLIAPAVLWAIDIVTRLVRMYVLYPSAKRAEVVSAIVYKDGASVMTRLDLSWPSALSINDMNEFAGGFFVVYCPEISNAQWHPMSISSAFPPAPTSSASATDIELSAVSKSKNPTFSLHIAATEPGQWTNALAAHLLSLSPNNTSNIVQLANPQLTVRVYGPMANRDLQVMDFPSLILIAGGVGVTPCVSVLDTLLHRYETQQSQQVVHLIWSSRSTQALTQWFAPIFDRVPSAAQYFKLHLYNTRATAPTSSGALTVLNGRPDLGLLMDEILASGSQQSLTPAQTAVFTCGPHAMMDQAQAIAASRGCHFHRESFAK